VNNRPTLDEFKTLYELSNEIKAMQPWDWIEEWNIFAVQNPETHKLGFVSIMGSNGEHFAVAVYLGEVGYAKFQALLELPPEDFSIADVMEIPHLQVSFEDRDGLREEDRRIIKQLSLNYRGRNEWPLFRSTRPGFVPWFVDASECRFLIHVLEQTLHVVNRAKKNPSLLMPDKDNRFLLRQPSVSDSSLKWKDSIWEEPNIDFPEIEVNTNMMAVERLKAIPKTHETLETSIFMVPTPIQEKDERPYFPYILLLVDGNQGLIMGHQLLSPQPVPDAMYGRAPAQLLQMMAEKSILPSQLLVDSYLFYDLLLMLTDELDIQVEYVEKLPNLVDVKNHFLQMYQ
jgi:hypothetical protein